MATNPDTIQQQEADRRKREAEAAALLALLLGRLKVKPLPKGALYSLPAMIANAKAKPTAFRRIMPTESLRSDIAAPYFDVVRAWAAERETILAAYANALPARGDALASGAVDDLLRAVQTAEQRIAGKLNAAEGKVAPSLKRLVTWHRTNWVQRVKAATGLDVARLTGDSEVAATFQNAVRAGVQATRTLSREIADRAATALVGNLTANIPASSAATALSGTFDAAKRRAARKGIDAADGLSSGITRDRRVAAGLDRYRWRHSPAVRYPRPTHVARDGKVFGPGNEPSERAGVLPGCQCWEEPVLI